MILLVYRKCHFVYKNIFDIDSFVLFLYISKHRQLFFVIWLYFLFIIVIWHQKVSSLFVFYKIKLWFVQEKIYQMLTLCQNYKIFIFCSFPCFAKQPLSLPPPLLFLIFHVGLGWGLAEFKTPAEARTNTLLPYFFLSKLSKGGCEIAKQTKESTYI